MRVLALSVFLAGCAGIDSTTFHWPQTLRPVAVIVDQTLPPECLVGIETALDWWRYQGVDYLQSMPGLPSDKPLIGEVIVTWEDLEFPMVGRCDRITVGDQLVKATIVLEACDPQLIAHEIGHSLGLDHREDPTALMYPESGNRWGLTDEEKEAVK